MRTVILTLSTCIFTFLLAAQQTDSTKKDSQFGISVNHSYNYEDDFFLTSINGIYRIKKHQMEFGPKFMKDKPDGIKSQLRLDFNYRYYPNGIGNRINFYFLFNTAYHFSKREVIYEYSSEDEYFLQIYRYRNHIIRFNAGYGFHVTVFKGLYIGNYVGAGIAFDKQNSTIIYEPSTLLPFSQKTLHEEPSVVFGLDIGYRF